MPIHHRIKPNTRILIVFFAAIAFIAVVQVGVYTRLFRTMEAEEQTINDERMNSASIRLDMVFSDLRDGYMDMIISKPFASIDSEPLLQTELLKLYQAADLNLRRPEGVRQWAVLLENSDKMVTRQGVMSVEDYANTFCRNDTFTTEFWHSLQNADFARRYLSQSEFHIYNKFGQYSRERLMPVVMRPYYSGNVLAVVALLDMTAVLEQVDAYLSEGVYLFGPDGSLLYTNDPTPCITALPEKTQITGGDGQPYAVYRYAGVDSLTYVKLLPKSQSADILSQNAMFSMGSLLIAMVVATVLMLPAVRRTFHPVNSMLELLRQHSELENVGDLHGAHEELEQILKLRQQQEAALAEKNAALSEYVLRSQLKNVYVDMEQVQQLDSSAFILYIQVQYRDTMGSYFNMTRAELENCLQEMLSATLNQLFETTLIFQLEPGRFAAKVTLPRPETKMGDRMERFMDRLSHEEEFAYFTVVQSELLQQQTDMAAVYTQVQDAARQAVVCDHSQLLTLPLKQSKRPEYDYSKAEEQQMYNAVREARTEDGVAIARQIIGNNLRRRIDHNQMEMLCVALVNTASYAIAELVPSAEKIAAASGVYNTLTSRCITGRDYTEAVVGFVRTATAAGDAREPEKDQLLKKVEQYLRENYQRDFSGEEMANSLWVSRSYLSSYYKSKTGMNLSDSIQMFRIQKAVELLKDPEVKVSELGSLVGIPSPNTFLRQFKKYTGMTPKEYRKQSSV